MERCRNWPIQAVFLLSRRQRTASRTCPQQTASTAKFWLGPVRLARSRDFPDHELRRIQRIVEDNLARIWEAWHEHFENRAYVFAQTVSFSSD